jgi:DNA-binding transcriptional LysR family regulator
LARHGTPTSPDDLEGHRMIGFVSTATRAVIPLEFGTGASTRMVTLPTASTVSAASTNAYLARLGLGLIQVPRYRVAHELATGALVEVLADWLPAPSPVYMLYLEGRQRSPRVRLFIDWATAVVSAELDRN